MYLHDGRVQLHGFDPDAHDLLPLQLFKDAVQCAILRPAVHAGIDRVPIAEALGQPTPLASLLGHIQNRVQHRQVRHADIATLTRQTGLYATVLRLRDLHKNRIPRKYQLVLTRPSSWVIATSRMRSRGTLKVRSSSAPLYASGESSASFRNVCRCSNIVNAGLSGSIARLNRMTCQSCERTNTQVQSRG